MPTPGLGEIIVVGALNIVYLLVFLIPFSILRLQPFTDRVYYPKLYLKGLRSSPRHSGAAKYVNLNWRSYLRMLNWVKDALWFPELELTDHAGLDSVAYLRIYFIGLKIFFPMTLLACGIIAPVNWNGNRLTEGGDKLTISNIPPGSPWIWTHVVMAYAFTFWVCYVLMKEYATIVAMRIHFLASEKRRPDQFTVLARNVPPDPDESVTECVEHFFLVNHPDHYLCHQVVMSATKLAKLVKEKKKRQNQLDYYQLKYSRNQAERPMIKTGFLGLCGDEADAIDYETTEIERLTREIAEERERVKADPKCIMPAAFVSFKSRWGAVMCAQSQQCSNPTTWLTEWAPELRDVYWPNMAIPYTSLSIRRFIAEVAFFFLTFLFTIPVSIAQSDAYAEIIKRYLQHLVPFIGRTVTMALIRGVLPAMTLTTFLTMLPTILMMMAKFSGLISISSLERRCASRLHIFNFFNIFLVSVIARTPLEHLEALPSHSPIEILKIIGVLISEKAGFFMTYVMLDGWGGTASDLLRWYPFMFFHLKNIFLVKTDKDRKEAMDPGSICFYNREAQIHLYFLLGLVYAVMTPLFLPLILVFFALSYVTFRHQIINVYNQEYESGAAFWPDVHARIVYALVFSQVVLMGFISTKEVAKAPMVLTALPVLTVSFHLYCKGRYESSFVRYPLQEAMRKDTVERALEPNMNLRGHLQNAYLHPDFKDEDEENNDLEDIVVELVPTRRRRQLVNV